MAGVEGCLSGSAPVIAVEDGHCSRGRVELRDEICFNYVFMRVDEVAAIQEDAVAIQKSALAIQKDAK